MASHGLSTRRGESPKEWIDRGTDKERREDIVTSVGGSENLAGLEEEEYRKNTGKKSPEGSSPKV